MDDTPAADAAGAGGRTGGADAQGDSAGAPENAEILAHDLRVTSWHSPRKHRGWRLLR